MGVGFVYPEFEVVRNDARCICCRVCERQCANEVHGYDAERGVMISDETKCVNCQRCVSLCPTRALKIVRSDCTLRENANWQNDTINEIYKQANSGGVLLSSMGNPKPLPVYWDRILINASQVTNPPIDPLREPMETKVFLGKKPDRITRDEAGKLDCRLEPQLELGVAVAAELFAHMQHGGGGNMGLRRQLPYLHIGDFRAVFGHVIVHRHFQGVQALDLFIGKHDTFPQGARSAPHLWA